jgi:hypothetical protein
MLQLQPEAIAYSLVRSLGRLLSTFSQDSMVFFHHFVAGGGQSACKVQHHFTIYADEN